MNSFSLTGIFGVSCLIEFFVVFLIFFYSQLLAISIILGLLNFLYLKYILVFSILLFFLILPHTKKIKLPELKVVSPKISILLSIVFSIHISYIFHLLILPPLTTDGLLYHLPFAVHYFKTGSISLPNLYFTDIAMTYYPIGGDIFYFFSLFSQREFLFNFTQFPFLILGSFSLFLLMKYFKFSDFLSVMGASIFSLLKPVLLESKMCFVDLIMASTFISTLYFFNKDEKKYIVPGILSLSILLSIKTFSIIFGILALPFLFFKKNGKFSLSFYFSIFFLIFFGLFSYIRNLLLTGNPVFPAEISIGKFVLFDGPYIYQKVSIYERFKYLFNILAYSYMHIDPPFFLKILLVFLFFVSLIISFRNRRLFFLYLIFPFSVLLYGFFIPPYYYQIRHLLPVYGILSISLIYPFRKLEYLCIPVFLYVWFSPLFTKFYLFFFSSFFILSISFFLVIYFKKPNFYFFYFLAFIFLLIFWIEKTNFIYEKIKFSAWADFYKNEVSLWKFVDENSKDGKNIAYVGDFLIYPFYGGKLQNNVYYQSVNSIETLPVYKYNWKNTKDQKEIFYRKNPSYQLWYKGLKEKKIDWIIVKKEGDYIEKEWIKNYPEIFKLLFTSDIAELYEFIN